MLTVIQQTAALLGRVGTLVELTRQIFDGKTEIRISVRERLLIDIIDGRFGEDGAKSFPVGFI